MLVGPGQVGLVGRQGALGNASTFNFLNGTLDPRINFSRASNATDFNPAGTLTPETTNAPRFDYNPLTLQPRGLLLEGARTNSVRSSEFSGATAGGTNFGTLWTSFANGGLTRTVAGVGTENGFSYVDYRVSGT
jgi:hypothetical protein